MWSRLTLIPDSHTRKRPGFKKGRCGLELSSSAGESAVLSVNLRGGRAGSGAGDVVNTRVMLAAGTGHDNPFTPSMSSSIVSEFVAPVVAPVTLRLPVWVEELRDDPNRDYILNGLRDGLMIVDRPCTLCNSWRRNYRSCLVDNKQAVEDQIWKEVKLGRYVITEKRPSVISSLGAVLKKNGKVRIIHDLSRPDGGINRFGVDSSVSYSTIDDALKLVKKGTFLAKVDLSEAYRSIPVHSSCFTLTGLQWIFGDDLVPTLLFDARF
jgi:hypothetical protein